MSRQDVMPHDILRREDFSREENSAMALTKVLTGESK